MRGGFNSTTSLGYLISLQIKKKHDLLKEKHDTTQNNQSKLVNFCQGFQRRNREKTSSRIEEILSLPRVSDNKLANIAREKEAKNKTQKTIY